MKEQIYSLLVAQGFTPQQSRLITAQSAHETGGWTSAIFLENNNPWGMKLALVRPTAATGSNRGHAVYPNLAAAALDFRYYWRAFGYAPEYATPEVYAQVLKQKNYYEDSYTNYSVALRRWYNQLWQK